MPRRKSENLVRDIGGDVRFNSVLVQKLINVVMGRGKKGVARNIVYEAVEAFIKKSGGNEAEGYAQFEKAVLGLKPILEVRPRRVGGGIYQVPTEVRPSRSLALALRWIVEAAKKRSDKTMGKRLANELLDAIDGRGGAAKKKSDVHRMAEANRAFSHYAW
ncbi:30S ribosomal protein S7 [Candidatus Babeliales bacterium]|nr:30S ribosomal protein S7 [Candidatus Babeliales bacterium]